MLSWKEIVQNYIIKHSNPINKATRPLRDHFGIPYFTYHRIDYQGHYTVLVDRPDFAEHYVSNKLFLQDPYLRHPDAFQSGIYCLDGLESIPLKDFLRKTYLDFFNAEPGLMLIEKTDACVEFFGFASSHFHQFEHLCRNHPPTLKGFSAYFKEALKPILEKMKLEPISLIELKGENFFCKKPLLPDPSRIPHQKFLADIGLSAYVSQAQRLSAREKECLNLLSKGCTAKETAAKLKLSPKTIEFYLENIKSKLDCSNKGELIAVSQLFDKYHLL